MCGEGKRLDARHRSLSANRRTGAWHCHRCGQKGLLAEYRTEDTQQDRRTRARAGLRRRLDGPAPAPASPPAADWRKRLPELVPLAGTPGAQYLTGRGLPFDLAHTAGVRYCPRWEHWAKDGERWALEGVSRRVVFPLRDRIGHLAGMQGRAIGGEEFGPKMMSRGQVQAGAFITPGALDGELLVVCEAPLDALTLFSCGLPAVGVTGCHMLPEWLLRVGVGRRVLIATDADDEGERAAVAWAERFGWARQVERLRPEGVKDWNERLQQDPEALRALCAGVIGRAEGLVVPPALSAAELVVVELEAEPEMSPVGDILPSEEVQQLAEYGLARCSKCRRIMLRRHLAGDQQLTCTDRADCREGQALARWRVG